MRRLWTIVVLLAILAGVSTPVLAALQVDEHACCRRGGAHHCSERAALSGPGISAHPANCPYQGVKPTVSVPAFILTEPSSLVGETVTSSALLPPAPHKATRDFTAATLDRGPPLA